MTSAKPSPWPAYRLGAMLLGTGTLHFVTPKVFDTIVPRELPGDARAYTYASGIAEIGTGALLLNPGTRRFGGKLAALLFVAVLPANFNMVRIWRRKPLPMQIGAVARLPMQIPLITTALKIARAPKTSA